MYQKINVLYVVNTIGGAAFSTMNMIHSVSQWVHPIVLVHKDSGLYDYFVNAGIETYSCYYPINRDAIKCGRNPLRYLYRELRLTWGYLRTQMIALRKLVPMLKDKNIQIVHSCLSENTTGFLLARKLHARHVCHVREFLDLDFDCRPVIGFPLTRLLMRKSDYVIAITEAVYNHWQLSRIRDHSTVLWNAVRKESDISFDADKDNYLLFCANYLSKNKGTSDAVKCFGMSGVWKDGFRLKLVGNIGSYDEAELTDVAKEYKCDKMIDFVGYQSDTSKYYKKAKAFLMMSYNEGLGRVTVEAMTYGCPVIGRNSGGTADLITNGVNGFLFDTDEQCVALIQRLVRRTPIDVIHNAHELVRRNLTEEVYGQKIWKIYQEIL